MSMQEWTERVVARHEEQVIAGEHDTACEWRANGHFICNCAARRRKAAGYTEPPEALSFSNPTCPRCYTETEHDGDCYRCEPCAVHWPDPNEPAEFTDDHGDLDVAKWDAAKAAQAGAAQA